MISYTRADDAYQDAIAFFDRLNMGDALHVANAARSAYVWRVVSSHASACDLYTALVVKGYSYAKLKQRLITQLMDRIDELPTQAAKNVREYAWCVGPSCADRIEVKRTLPRGWRAQVESDARGIFLSWCFTGPSETQLFFNLVRAAYEAGGFPCGLPGWPSTEIALYTAPEVLSSRVASQFQQPTDYARSSASRSVQHVG